MTKGKLRTASNGRQQVEVWADWDWSTGPALMGHLFAARSRGKEVFSFEYDAKWVRSHEARVLDPSLHLDQGLQYADPDRGNFGLFLDSSPDRWGRILMQRREQQRARDEGRKPRVLGELDFLLGVHDLQRVGGLRFKIEEGGAFLDDESSNAAPPWASLRELEHASFELERKDCESDPHYNEWLKLLTAPGSSLGGARPKASVVDEMNHLWIAKFPSRQDTLDIGAWEMLVHELAQRASVNVAPAQAKALSNSNHEFRTFLAKRFDRTMDGKRIHFSSAMNLLSRDDGDDFSKGANYLELVDLIARIGAAPEEDLEQLWRRIAFFVCVSNTDDHLRNHGFLLQLDGWRLSPAYDVNPVASGDGLTLNISETDNALDLDLVRSVAGFFRLKLTRADEIINQVVQATKTWRSIAEKLGIKRSEQELMSRAFNVADEF